MQFSCLTIALVSEDLELATHDMYSKYICILSVMDLNCPHYIIVHSCICIYVHAFSFNLLNYNTLA